MTRCSPVITQQQSHLLWVDSLPSPVLQEMVLGSGGALIPSGGAPILSGGAKPREQLVRFYTVDSARTETLYQSIISPGGNSIARLEYL